MDTDRILKQIRGRRSSFEQRRRGLLGGMAADTGIPTGPARSERKALERGMNNGLVRFTPDTNGGGTLDAQVLDDQGNPARASVHIEPGHEAALILGVQVRVDRERGSR